MSYAIHYELAGATVETDSPAARTALAAAVEAYAWADHLGPDFLDVKINAARDGAPSAVRFVFEGIQPSLSEVPAIVARIDNFVDKLRKLPF